MYSFLLLFCTVAVAFYAFYTWRCFMRNLDGAKRSGIPYIISPIYTFNRFWLLTHRLWLPIIYRLPDNWTKNWRDFITPDAAWDHLYEPFQRLGTSAFLVVAPAKNSLLVADPDAITQITTRRNDFPKPLEFYGSINLYGKNVVGTEGSVWRHHRKITSPPFSEKSNVLVFRESIRQAQAMLASWVGPDGNLARTVHDVAEDTMRLSLHVISRAGFGVHLMWPHEEEPGKTTFIPEGHKMTYKDAISTLLHNIAFLLLLPRWFLKYAPFKATKLAYTSFMEWGMYMDDMYQAKKNGATESVPQEGLDLMGALVNASGVSSAQKGYGEKKSGKGASADGAMLSAEEIIGNAFVFILAGHETAANSIHFSLLFLAMNPQSQRRVQHDLDKIGISSKSPSKWDYETDLPKLFGGMVGAVMNEELRLLPPVISIPKSTRSPQPLNLNGRRCVVPADCSVNLISVAVQRNPNVWPSTSPEDLNNFRPERWILSSSGTSTPIHHAAGAATTSASTLFADGEFGGPGGADTAPTLMKPPKGAYIPFSDGARSCLGRRFAQVEILAVLAVILRDYSVELAVDEYATDGEVFKMNDAERRGVWQKAADKASWLLKHGMGSIITLQFRKGYVPMRFVKRGSERFRFE